MKKIIIFLICIIPIIAYSQNAHRLTVPRIKVDTISARDHYILLNDTLLFNVGKVPLYYLKLSHDTLFVNSDTLSALSTSSGAGTNYWTQDGDTIYNNIDKGVLLKGMIRGISLEGNGTRMLVTDAQGRVLSYPLPARIVSGNGQTYRVSTWINDTTHVAGRIFDNLSDSLNALEKMTFSKAAYFEDSVGIGTHHPTTALDVMGTGSFSKIVGNQGYPFQINAYPGAGLDLCYGNTTAKSNLSYYGFGTTAKVIFFPTGKVFINTATDTSANLVVNGKVKLLDTLYVKGKVIFDTLPNGIESDSIMVTYNGLTKKGAPVQYDAIKKVAGSSYTLLTTDRVILFDGDHNDLMDTLKLPLPSLFTKLRIVVSKVGSDSVKIIAPVSGSLFWNGGIAEVTTYIIIQAGYGFNFEFVSDGTNWYIIREEQFTI